MNIKNLKPTEICIKLTAENVAEVMQLMQSIGGVHPYEEEFYPRIVNSYCYLGSIIQNEIFCTYDKESFNEITISELRQMAGVEEIKPTVFDLMDSEGSELSALRKENEELRGKIENYERLAKSAEEIYRADNSDVDMIMTPIGLISGSTTLEDLKP